MSCLELSLVVVGEIVCDTPPSTSWVEILKGGIWAQPAIRHTQCRLLLDGEVDLAPLVRILSWTARWTPIDVCLLLFEQYGPKQPQVRLPMWYAPWLCLGQEISIQWRARLK
eukprot:10422338-Lingulodinium_polyedra.AAC.1